MTFRLLTTEHPDVTAYKEIIISIAITKNTKYYIFVMESPIPFSFRPFIFNDHLSRTQNIHGKSYAKILKT